MDRLLEMQVFARMVETGSFTETALSMAMTQSAVSKIIKRIEDRMDTLLLARTPRSVNVTPEGRDYYQRISKVLSAVDEADSLVDEWNGEAQGVLNIYATPSFALHRLAPLVPEYLRRHPNMSVDIDLATGPLRSLDCSMDIGFYPYSMIDSGMISRRFMQTRWALCASPEYVARHGAPLRPQDLAEHACITYSGAVPCNMWQVWDSDRSEFAALAIEGAVSSTNSEMLLALARAGAGIVRLHEDQMAQALASGELVELLRPPEQAMLYETLYVVYHSRRQLPKRAAAFLELFAEAIGTRCQWQAKPTGESKLVRLPERIQRAAEANAPRAAVAGG